MRKEAHRDRQYYIGSNADRVFVKPAYQNMGLGKTNHVRDLKERPQIMESGYWIRMLHL